jgi:mannose-6-phosphate isomerase-like protein (cupin superfamily)
MSQTDTYHLLCNLLRFRAKGESGYCLVEAITAPGAGAPPNKHPADNEAFYVLEGSFEFMIDGETRRADGGDFVNIPNGALHAFKNVGATNGRLLILNVPGTSHVSFFSEAGDPMPPGTTTMPAPGGPPDIPRLLEIGRRNGMTFVV